MSFNREISQNVYKKRLCHLNSIDNMMPEGFKKPLYGVEIELEGDSCGDIDSRAVPEWYFADDGSLRGTSVELVLRSPRSLEDTRKSLANLKETFKDLDNFDISPRCSVHIHLNALCMTAEQYHKFCVLFFLLENLLVRRAGGVEREGNLFVLRASDSYAIVENLVSCFQNEFALRPRLNTVGRYGNFNPDSFRKFGSIEIRCHRGTSDIEEIERWFEVLVEIQKVSDKRFTSARNIIEEVSGQSEEDFLQVFTPKTYKYLMEAPSENLSIGGELETLFEEGLENAQYLAYCVRPSEKK